MVKSAWPRDREAFLTELEHYALLIGAVGHDLGHPGVNNGFLSEASSYLIQLMVPYLRMFSKACNWLHCIQRENAYILIL